MTTLLALLRKEFIQIVRNKPILLMMIGMPIVQLLILAHAATFELQKVEMVVVDNERSAESRRLIGAFTASGFFKVVDVSDHVDQALDYIESNSAMFVLVIPSNLTSNIHAGIPGKLQMMISGEDGVKAGLIQAYSNGIIQLQARNYLMEMMPVPQGASSIEVRELFAYNPNLDYKYYMVPGILVLLVTLVGMLLSAMNIVREKEIGTIEQLNVTPIRRWQFISAKMLPFWIIGMLELAIGLVIAKLVFNVPMIGNLALVFASAAIYLLVVLSIGLLISTVTQTQQQAMFISWFFLVIFILMSGLFTPIQSMPDWAQIVTRFNPVSYFIEIMRRVLLKGAGWHSIQLLVWSLAAYAALMLTLAVWRYQKVAH
jgi:ABC-2 type transport system permease protein